jgi:hypothetical protein
VGTSGSNGVVAGASVLGPGGGGGGGGGGDGGADVCGVFSASVVTPVDGCVDETTEVAVVIASVGSVDVCVDETTDVTIASVVVNVVVFAGVSLDVGAGACVDVGARGGFSTKTM